MAQLSRNAIVTSVVGQSILCDQIKEIMSGKIFFNAKSISILCCNTLFGKRKIVKEIIESLKIH